MTVLMFSSENFFKIVKEIFAKIIDRGTRLSKEAFCAK